MVAASGNTSLDEHAEDRYPDPIYRIELNPRYKDNPLITALPDVPTYSEAYLALALLPDKRAEDFRSQAQHRRLDLLGELQHIFVPTNLHIATLQKIVAVVRDCYEARNPNLPEVQRHLYRAAQGERTGLTRLSKSGGGSNGMVLWGITGSGKTSFLDRLVAYLYSQQAKGGAFTRGAIYHRMIQGRRSFWPQLPVVRMQCKTTLKGTISTLFAQIDEALGTSHSSRIGSRWTRDIFVNLVQQVMTTHFTGLLIVEDAHKLKDSTDKILDYFCDIMEESGFPILLVATYKFRTPLLADPAIASKLTAKGIIDFPPLSLSSEDPKNKRSKIPNQDWVMFVQGLWGLNVFKQARDMPVELPEWLHFHSKGVRRIAREMMSHAFERSVRDDKLVVDEALFDDIAADEMAHYQRPLSALRRQPSGALIDDEQAELFEHFMLPLDARLDLGADIKVRNQERLDKKAAQAAGQPAAPAAPAGSNSPSEDASSKKPATKPRPRKSVRKSSTPETAKEVYDRLKAAGKVSK